MEALNNPNTTDNEEGTSAPVKKAFSLKPTKQTCIGLAGAIAVILLGGGSLYAWQSGELSKATVQTQEKRKELEDGRRIAKRREEVQGEYQAILKKLRFLEVSVAPGTEFEASFLDQVSNLARREKLQVSELTYTWEFAAKSEPPKKKKAAEEGDKGAPSANKEEKKVKVNPYDLLHMDMTVKGPYSNVAHFMLMLNQFPKIVAIEKVDVQPEDQFKMGKESLVTAKIKMTGFAFKASEQNHLGDAGGKLGSSVVTTTNPLLPGNGASSQVRKEQNEVMGSSEPANNANTSPSNSRMPTSNSSNSSVPTSNSSVPPSNSGAPGVPRPKVNPSEH